MVEFTRIDNEGRHAIDVDGYPHGVIRIENGKVKRLMIHSETTNVIPTQDLLRAIADKLDELNKSDRNALISLVPGAGIEPARRSPFEGF